MNKAKIFILHHPVTLIFYKNLAEKMKEYDKNVKIILFKVNHKYFFSFDFSSYEKYFDQIINFDFISYNKNIFKGFWGIFKFQRKLKRVISELSNFEEIDLFLASSAWLPVNIMLFNLSKESNTKTINKISFFDPQSSGTKTDGIKTLFCSLYSLFFGCYKVKAISTLAGKFVNFEYTEKIPGRLLKIVSPTSQLKVTVSDRKEIFFPYPIEFKNLSAGKRDMVIIFGDSNIFEFYSEFLPDKETFNRKMILFFKAIEKKYPDSQLYYKPHPSDNGKIAPGIDIKRYKFFDNSVDIQVFFDKMNHKIKAVYSFCSVSIMFGSFFSIPSYASYRYFFDQAGIDKFDDLFCQENIKSKFLFHISDLSQIGVIDNLIRLTSSDSLDIEKKYREILNF